VVLSRRVRGRGRGGDGLLHRGATGPVAGLAAGLDCVFDKAAYATALAPPPRLVVPAAAEAAGTSLQSGGGMCRASLEPTVGPSGGFGPGPKGG
jgi:hypothetical protein